jgi:mono/diheme cytochrome c family protein
MKTWWLALIPFVASFVGIGFWVGGTRSAPPILNPVDRSQAVSAPQVLSPADQARATFKAKCAGCHGPDLQKPKGRFGYVLDLGKIAANREMVVPGRPEQSELWELVEHNEMPPEGSPHGPLTPAQKETIRNWIAASAPE